MGRKGKAPEPSPSEATEPTHLPSTGPATTEAEPPSEPSTSTQPPRILADRQAMLERLKLAKNQAGRANARALAASESSKKMPTRPTEFKARKLANAQTELERMDAQARGEDVDRLAHWNYSVEDTEKWNQKLEAKAERADQGAVDHTTEAERAYARKIRALTQEGKKKVHRSAVAAGPSTEATHGPRGGSEAEDLGGTISEEQEEHYGSHTPSNDAVDAVVKHMSTEAATRASRSRKRAADPDAEVTYINERNKAFNDRVSRFYDRYTKDIKDNLERGTAL